MKIWQLKGSCRPKNMMLPRETKTWLLLTSGFDFCWSLLFAAPVVEAGTLGMLLVNLYVICPRSGLFRTSKMVSTLLPYASVILNFRFRPRLTAFLVPGSAGEPALPLSLLESATFLVFVGSVVYSYSCESIMIPLKLLELGYLLLSLIFLAISSSNLT